MRQNVEKASNDLKAAIFKSQRVYRKRLRKARKLCEKADEKYVPYGLTDLVPASWECEFPSKSVFKKT